VPHCVCQDWKLGLDIDSGTIPSKQDVNSVGVPHVMDARQTPLLIVDLGRAEELSQAMGEACTSVRTQAARTAHQKWRVSAMYQAATNSKVDLYLVNCIIREGDKS
jgi:hypothetical protein